MAPPTLLQVILDGPALQPPLGVIPNFVNPSNINTTCFAVLGICLVGTAIAFFMRMYTKWVILRRFDWEDYVLMLGVAFFVAYTGIALKIVFLGAGVHQWNIQVKNIEPLLHWTNTEEILYSFAMPFTKASILLQYLRIFTKVNKKSFMWISCWAIIFSMSIFYVIALFLQIFACTPREKFWNPLIAGHCLNTEALNTSTGAYNVLTDIILVLLPQQEIWRLQLSSKKKAAISAVFFAALCACVSSALRLYYSIRIEQTGDVSYFLAPQGLWTVGENAIAIICCCLPVCPRFFKEFVPKVVSLYENSFPIKTSSKPRTPTKTTRRHRTGPSQSDGTWNTSSGPESKVHATYETLEDGHELLPMGNKEGDRGDMGSARFGEFPVHELNDSRGIRLLQTFEVQSSPAMSVDMDLEAQKRVKRAQMGW